MALVRFIRATRYLVLIPVPGLAIAAAALFVLGGVGLLNFIVEAWSMRKWGSLPA